MKEQRRTGRVALLALLMLLALLTFLVVKREYLTDEEAQEDAVRVVVKLKDWVVRHDYAAITFLAGTVLFAFVMWAALRANKGEDKEPIGESSPSDTTASR